MGFPVTPRILQLIKDGNAVWTGRATRSRRAKKTRIVARPAGELLDRVTLPIPPSQNNLYLNVKRKGRVPTREYTAWKKLAYPLVERLRPPASYPCKFFFLIGGKVNMRSDGGNREKALLDATVNTGVIPDDSLKYVRGGIWHYEESGEEPYATIWFETWD